MAQPGWERMRPFANRSGAQSYDKVARPGDRRNGAREGFLVFDRVNMSVPRAAHALDELVPVEAIRHLARRIDWRDKHRVGIPEALAEPIEQRLQPGEAMRLHDGDHAAVSGAPRGAQRGLDLGGVMGVIVVNRDAVPFPCPGEPVSTPSKEASASNIVAGERPM